MLGVEADDFLKNEYMNIHDQEPGSGYGRPCFFGRPPREHNVTFCIDTSGSMYGCLEVVKENLISVLGQHATPDGENTFNLIEFSTEIVQWADRLVKCTPETVQVATQWIATLKPKTGTNTVDAVVTAFADRDCEAVYLITDSVPDQHTDQAIDQIILAAGNRPVHCFYIQGGNPDVAVVDFLREVAMETYGSLHVITVAHHGAIERVVPIYRADLAAERIVRSTSGNVYPTNHKMCSVMTSLPPGDLYPQTLALPPGILPPYGVYLQPHSLPPPPYPYCLFPWPYRYYCFYASPAYGWSRYRPAKAWINHAKSFVDGMSLGVPSAGAMLIGTRVLARRHSDGLFYLGSVKSQILHNKFLVEFGPCKHGRYKDTEYQETFVYDIVSHADALRHPVLVEDKVLAPWEPEGERYAPGIVIDGQEKRIVEGGGPDKQLVVTFSDGKTASMEKDKAIWIPSDLHERIVFELNLPRNVRKELSQKDFYPMENLPGYPSSGTKAFPAEFPRYVPPGWMESNSKLSGDPGSMWYSNPQPWYHHSNTPNLVATKTADVDCVIPGTEMTKSQLNEKVASQIQANNDRLSKPHDEQCVTGVETRNRSLENSDSAGSRAASGSPNNNRSRSSMLDTGLKKSVSFADLRSKADQLDCDLKDSGHGSQTDLYLTDDEDINLSDTRSLTKRDASSITDISLLYPRTGRRSLSAGRKPWKYWKNDPAPSVLEPMHYGPYRVGPYRDSMEMPLLLKDAKRNEYGVEWTSSVSRVVDPWARYNRKPTVYDSMYVPKPPERRPEKQAPGRDFCEILGENQRQQDNLADTRRDFRQRQVLEREIGWQRRAAEADYSQQLMLDLRRQQVQSHINRNIQRHNEEQEKMQRHLESRRLAQQRHLQTVSEGLGEKERKEAERMAYKTMQRENRIIETAQRNLEKQETAAKRQAAREIQNIARVQAMSARVIDEERQMIDQSAQKERAHANRVAFFTRKENEAQQRKQLADKVTSDAKAIHCAYVMP